MMRAQIQAENATEQVRVFCHNEYQLLMFKVALIRGGVPHRYIEVSWGKGMAEATIPTPLDREKLAQCLWDRGLRVVIPENLKRKKEEMI